MGSERALL